MEGSPESLGPDEISRGKLLKASAKGYTRKSFDILAAFLDVLGNPVGEAPANYDRGELIVDSSMDLETNASQGLARDNVLMLRPGGGRNRPDQDGPNFPLRHQRHRHT